MSPLATASRAREHLADFERSEEICLVIRGFDSPHPHKNHITHGDAVGCVVLKLKVLLSIEPIAFDHFWLIVFFISLCYRKRI